MTYVIKANMYVEWAQDPDDLESKTFWKKTNLIDKRHPSNQVERKVDDFLAKQDKKNSNLKNSYSDELGNPNIVKLEFDIQPEIFSDLEKAGLRIGCGRKNIDVEVSIYAISDLGITLFLEYYPSNDDNDEDDPEKDLMMFNGNVFIPFHRLVSINTLHSDLVDDIYINKAILNKKAKAIP